jgi:hypothetical protein
LRVRRQHRGMARPENEAAPRWNIGRGKIGRPAEP